MKTNLKMILLMLLLIRFAEFLCHRVSMKVQPESFPDLRILPAFNREMC